MMGGYQAKSMMISRPLRSSSQSTQRKQFLSVGEGPTNKKVSSLLKFLLAEGQSFLRRIGISPILFKEICLRGLRDLCVRPLFIRLRQWRAVRSVREKLLISRPLRSSSQSTQRKQFLFVGEGPTNKKVSSLLNISPSVISVLSA